jgi:hypothetical protein
MLKAAHSPNILKDIRQNVHLQETSVGSKVDFTNTDELSVCETIKKGHFNLVRFILDLGGDPDERDTSGKTALCLCAFIAQESWGVGLARTFIEKGATIGLRDGLGLSAAHYACIYGRVDLMEVFLNAIDFDLNQGDRLRHTPLSYAAKSGNVDLVRLLVRCHKRFNVTVDKPNRLGLTPLMQAWKLGHFDCGDILVSEGGADEEIQDSKHKTARYWRDSTKRRLEKERAMSARVRSAFSRGRYGYLEKRVKRPATAMRDLLESERKRCVLPMEPDNAKLIRRIKDHDTRNDPEYALNLTPVECFLVDKYNQPSRSIYQYTGDLPATTWRKEFRILYKKFEIQCSPSYREAPKPQPLENTTETDEHDRPPSPSVSESTSLSDKASVRSFGKHGRRPSNISVAAKVVSSLEGKESKRGQKCDSDKHGRERPPSAGMGKRKLTGLNPFLLNKGKLEPVLGSNESLNSGNKNGLDSKQSFGSKLRDAMDGGKLGRPISRTGFHVPSKSRAEN